MATPWDPVDMEKTAFHEAGHAIVEWSLGVPPARIYLDLENRSGGTVPAVDPSRLCLVQQIAIHYAGPKAEEIFTGFARARDHAARADHLWVHVLLEKNGTPEEEPEGQALQTSAYACAEKLLRRHEPRIRRVANRLMRPPHKLNGARFKRLMREG
jgi:hypothetical protein